jgi:hypothetical protein
VRAFATVAVPILAGGFCLAARALAIAPAKPPPVVLEWHGPDDCQQAPRLLSEVERIVAGAHGASSLVARVTVDRVGRRWHLVLAMDHAGRTTVRELDAETCSTATDAAAVILALTIDTLGHDEADAGTSGQPAPDAGPTDVDAGSLLPPYADAAPTTSEEPPPDDAGDRSSSLPLILLAEVASDTGTLPRTGFGFAGGLGFVAKPLRVEATLGYWPGVSTDLASAPSRGGSFAMFVTELRGCALAEASFLSLGGCAGAGLTTMRAEAFGVTTPISATASWSSFVADGVMIGRLSRVFSLRLNAGMAVPFARATFEVEGVGVVHRPAAAALELGTGVEAHF